MNLDVRRELHPLLPDVDKRDIERLDDIVFDEELGKATREKKRKEENRETRSDSGNTKRKKQRRQPFESRQASEHTQEKREVEPVEPPAQSRGTSTCPLRSAVCSC
jgi:hypothetical protein